MLTLIKLAFLVFSLILTGSKDLQDALTDVLARAIILFRYKRPNQPTADQEALLREELQPISILIGRLFIPVGLILALTGAPSDNTQFLDFQKFIHDNAIPILFFLELSVILVFYYTYIYSATRDRLHVSSSSLFVIAYFSLFMTLTIVSEFIFSTTSLATLDDDSVIFGSITLAFILFVSLYCISFLLYISYRALTAARRTLLTSIISAFWFIVLAANFKSHGVPENSYMYSYWVSIIYVYMLVIVTTVFSIIAITSIALALWSEVVKAQLIVQFLLVILLLGSASLVYNKYWNAGRDQNIVALFKDFVIDETDDTDSYENDTHEEDANIAQMYRVTSNTYQRLFADVLGMTKTPGSTEYHYVAGYMYEHGLGTSPNIQLAVKEYLLSDFVMAKLKLAHIYENSQFFKNGGGMAVNIYNSIADTSLLAKYRMAILYDTGGNGITESKSHAFEIYKDISEQNNDAMFKVAFMLEEGIGIKQDVQMSIPLYLDIADSNSDALYRLGKIYLYGKGNIHVDERLGSMYIIRSAINGNVAAQKILANIYQHGSAEIPKNEYVAKIIYEEIMRGGDDSVKNNIDAIEHRTTPDKQTVSTSIEKPNTDKENLSKKAEESISAQVVGEPNNKQVITKEQKNDAIPQTVTTAHEKDGSHKNDDISAKPPCVLNVSAKDNVGVIYKYDEINVRACPAKDCNKVGRGTLKRGEKVIILKKHVTDIGTWDYVKFMTNYGGKCVQRDGYINDLLISK